MNVLQLMTNGVGVRDIAKSRVKLVEINQHLKNEARKVEIEAGEFSTISEGLTEADAAISQGEGRISSELIHRES